MSYHHSTVSSMNFPPGTITSKLSSRKLKKPPSPKDWMHQTYLQMIQDVSYATSHYYESTDNGNQLLFGNKVCPDKYETHCLAQNATIAKSTPNHTAASPPTPPPKDCFPSDTSVAQKNPKGKEKENQVFESNEEDNDYDEEDDSDSQSEYYNTFTTTSTDCDRKNNIYRFYKEQQSIQADPITEESSVIRVATPYSSSSSCNISSHSAIEYIDSSGSEVSQDLQQSDDGASTATQQQSGPKRSKKKFKLLKNMMTKMKMAAEKPFWAIDSHF